jgi:transcriptional regulator GlxA family with amidase domain
MTQEIKTIAIVGYPDASEQDTITPLEIFKGAAMVLGQKGQKGQSLDVKLLSIDSGDRVKMQMGTQVMVDGTLGGTDVFDLLYVPGGVGSGAMTRDARMISAIKRHHEAGKVIASNCSGVGILHRSGILGTTPVTAVAAVVRRMRQEGTNVPQPRRMWLGVPEARIWTATGSSGVHGAAVGLVAYYFGRDVAQTVSMMFDTLGAYGDYIYQASGPEYYFHPDLETEFQGIWEDKLLPV